MRTRNHSRNKSSTFQRGFSLIEVLIAFSILIIVIVGIFEIRLSSIRRLERTAQMNQIQNMISSDLSSIRKEALRWQCQQGVCSGLKIDRNLPARYLTNHCAQQNPLDQFPIKSLEFTDDSYNISLSRQVEINGKQLEITYIGTAGEQSTSTSTSIIPQAMSWCD